MQLPAWLSAKKREAERTEREAATVAREELFECMMLNVPEGMTLAPEVKKSMRSSLERIDAATARKSVALIQTRRAEHMIIVLTLWDVLERSNPNAALNRLSDNFDYIIRIGWGYTGSMPGFILRAFPGNLLEADLGTEQQHALLRLEDSRWEKDLTREGGSKHSVRLKDIEGLADLVVARPHDVERIIELATTRKPESIGHYVALLGSTAPEPLKEGEL